MSEFMFDPRNPDYLTEEVEPDNENPDYLFEIGRENEEENEPLNL